MEKEEQFNPELGPSPEVENDLPSIRLEFFRHDDKEFETSDPAVPLSQAGRKHATEAGRARQTHPEVALAYGSSRVRTTETALRQVLSPREEIKPEHSLGDIQKIIDQELNDGQDNGKMKKSRVLPQLDFHNHGTEEYHQVWLQHYRKDKDAMRFVYHDSDRLAQQLKDQESTSYSRGAGNVAELIQRNLGILPRWQRIVKQNPNKYKEYNNELQRFFSSHHAVLEPFLMKVIERTEGKEAVKEFIESLPSKNGFGFSEGYSVVLSGDSDQPTVTLKYGDKKWVIPPEMLAEIIQERDELNELTKPKQ